MQTAVETRPQESRGACDISSTWELATSVLTRTERMLIEAALPGVRFWVPTAFDPTNENMQHIVDAIGEEIVRKLCGIAPCTLLCVPSGRERRRRRQAYLVRRLAKQGASHSTIALALGLTERTVSRIVSGDWS